MLSEKTIASLVTAPITQNIALIRISGSQTYSIISQIFDRPLPEYPHQKPQLIFGKIVNSQKEVVDEVLLLCFYKPHSFTGEDVVEISCHGNLFIVNQIIQLILEKGAELAQEGEFTKQAFFNNKLNLIQANAINDLIRAPSLEAAKLAQHNLSSETQKGLEIIENELLDIIANIKVNIDYPEYDGVEYLTGKATFSRLNKLLKILKMIKKDSKKVRLYQEGLKIAIVGKPNVGKSTLLNALLQEEKAIVSPIAGTTRDVVEARYNLNGIPLILLDTAGIHQTSDLVEKIGVKKKKTCRISAKKQQLSELEAKIKQIFAENINRELKKETGLDVVCGDLEISYKLVKELSAHAKAAALFFNESSERDKIEEVENLLNIYCKANESSTLGQKKGIEIDPNFAGKIPFTDVAMTAPSGESTLAKFTNFSISPSTNPLLYNIRDKVFNFTVITIYFNQGEETLVLEVDQEVQEAFSQKGFPPDTPPNGPDIPDRTPPPNQNISQVRDQAKSEIRTELNTAPKTENSELGQNADWESKLNGLDKENEINNFKNNLITKIKNIRTRKESDNDPIKKVIDNLTDRNQKAKAEQLWRKLIVAEGLVRQGKFDQRIYDELSAEKNNSNSAIYKILNGGGGKRVEKVLQSLKSILDQNNNPTQLNHKNDNSLSK
ncbi:12455_t:CDS:2 [Funneliformis geosporum]|uniref:12455_t:CDS:1 n=1 Tax=Funneliformis geosporum TaxID=1117311 RepID=A0A9W4WHJ7_9GLOM|nr:12455_t:CDS:2 [Funneliformis geosporum]